MRLIVVGGGAAGFFCAVNAARLASKLEVIIIEKSSKLLSKVRISGGGRCNLTHNCDDIQVMARRYPRGGNFVKKAFHQFFTHDTIEWFESRGVKIKAEEDGRMFPVSDTSQSIIDCLLREANKFKVEVRLNREVKHISRAGDQWNLEFTDDQKMETDFLCLACGGYPKAAMFEWIKSAGHSIEEPVPSLFTFNMPGHTITSLMGISVPEAQVKIMGSKLVEKGPMLITHWGLSGPVILRLSAWGARELSLKQYHFRIMINWLPAYHEQSLREELVHYRNEHAGHAMQAKNPFGLPHRLWLYLLQEASIEGGMNWGNLPAAAMNKLVKQVCAFEADIKGKTTFKEEFVTAGGIKLSEVDANTMQSRICHGLFFAGEILDVDGITGGYNFQHAWTSGYIAAAAIAGMVSQEK